METYPAPAGVQTQAAPDRAALRALLEATRTNFHRQVAAAAGDRWRSKSPFSAWTVGEVLVHLTWALEQLPKEVEMARQGRGMFNLPKWIADPGSYWLIRWLARNSSPESVRRRYDAAMDAALASLEAVSDADWNLGAPFYGHGFHTIVDLFETPASHLAEHTGQS
ncbi:MAG TPA: DinB family protein [Anaerolineae bacterium]